MSVQNNGAPLRAPTMRAIISGRSPYGAAPDILENHLDAEGATAVGMLVRTRSGGEIHFWDNGYGAARSLDELKQKCVVGYSDKAEDVEKFGEFGVGWKFSGAVLGRKTLVRTQIPGGPVLCCIMDHESGDWDNPAWEASAEEAEEFSEIVQGNRGTVTTCQDLWNQNHKTLSAFPYRCAERFGLYYAETIKGGKKITVNTRVIEPQDPYFTEREDTILFKTVRGRIDSGEITFRIWLVSPEAEDLREAYQGFWHHRRGRLVSFGQKLSGVMNDKIPFGDRLRIQVLNPEKVEVTHDKSAIQYTEQELTQIQKLIVAAYEEAVACLLKMQEQGAEERADYEEYENFINKELSVFLSDMGLPLASMARAKPSTGGTGKRHKSASDRIRSPGDDEPREGRGRKQRYALEVKEVDDASSNDLFRAHVLEGAILVYINRLSSAFPGWRKAAKPSRRCNIACMVLSVARKATGSIDDESFCQIVEDLNVALRAVYKAPQKKNSARQAAALKRNRGPGIGNKVLPERQEPAQMRDLPDLTIEEGEAV